MQIFVKTLTGKTITLDANHPTQSIMSRLRSKTRRESPPINNDSSLPANSLRMVAPSAITTFKRSPHSTWSYAFVEAAKRGRRRYTPSPRRRSVSIKPFPCRHSSIIVSRGIIRWYGWESTVPWLELDALWRSIMIDIIVERVELRSCMRIWRSRERERDLYC